MFVAVIRRYIRPTIGHVVGKSIRNSPVANDSLVPFAEVNLVILNGSYRES